MDEIAIYEDDLPAISNDSLIAVAEMAQKRVEAVKKIKAAALAVTNKHDWKDLGGKPYLEVSGAEKVARVFGISWRIEDPVCEREEDGHFSFTYKGEFSMGPVSIEVIGSRSSKDPFFSKRKRTNEDGETESYILPPQEVDRNDIKKAALTNCIGSGVTRLLGIRNLTWEEVGGAGINRSEAGRVDYGVSDEKVTKHREDIRDMVLEMAGNDPERAIEKLKELTAWTTKDGKYKEGKSHVEDLSDKQVPVVYGKVKAAFNSWLDEQAAAQ